MDITFSCEKCGQNIVVDEAGAGIVVDSFKWTLSDMDGNVLNGRSSVSATATGTTVSVVLSGTDLSIVSGQTNERLFTVVWTYSSSYGTNLPANDQAIFVIDNLLKVT